ncbi:hypothetical protein [Tepidanaerobacter syntrophicus]|uniref:Uncharacterized protein n=1 Tax=Tepidanaerobacter syntrophicus TaxID=224999 RepID=A0A0U9HBK3_9FIRM|nr:hypothetical protein [Tepidanaerobacter syntrophicus]GAQ24128.1 hypothetical protein TSYNT_1113 [Tepidanaerobacter syntrophicus]
MKNLFDKMNKIIETENGTEVRGALFIRDDSGKMEIGLMVRSILHLENGKRRKKYSEILRLDFENCFEESIEEKLKPLKSYGFINENDIRKIASYIMINWKNLNKIIDDYKMDFVKVCKVLLDNKDKEISFNNRTYITILTGKFDEIALECGWIPLHLKKQLNLNGVLYRNSGRYDYHRRKDEPRVICIDKELLEGEINDAEI